MYHPTCHQNPQLVHDVIVDLSKGSIHGIFNHNDDRFIFTSHAQELVDCLGVAQIEASKKGNLYHSGLE